MKNCAVIFDLDGTLLDTLPDITDAMNFVLEKHGLNKRELCEVRSFVGHGVANLVERSICDGNDVDRESDDIKRLIAECLAEFRAYYDSNCAIKTRPFDGIVEVVDRLRSIGVRLAVISNKPDGTTKYLCHHFFGDKLEIVLGDSPDFPRKPCPDSLLYVIDQLECERAVYVGDSNVDVEVAKNANIPCVSLTWGFKDRDFLIEHGAERLADNSDQLFEHLINILELQEEN